MNQKLSTPKDPRILSYLGLRKAVGYIAVALPFVLAIGYLPMQGGLLDSISAYYYTCLHNVLVGSLCIIGIFLMACIGYDFRDRIAGLFAGIFAIGVALCPTTPPAWYDAVCRWKVGHLHLVFASLLFLTLAYFCLFLFIKSDTDHPTPAKRSRNLVYRVSGVTILVSITLAGIFGLAGIDPFPHSLFFFESVAVEAFGVAWLTKGEAILSDKAGPRSALWVTRDHRSHLPA